MPFEFYTTQLIVDEELYDEQVKELQLYIDSGQLIVKVFTYQELITIATINQEKPQLSDRDCPAFFCADDLGAVLLTSDSNLRKFAKKKAVEVHGHLWLLDELVKEGCMIGTEAADILDKLDVINPRLKLPQEECDKRKEKWK